MPNKIDDISEFVKYFKENCIQKIEKTTKTIIESITAEIHQLLKDGWITIDGDPKGIDSILISYMKNFLSDDIKIWQLDDIKHKINIVKKNDLLYAVLSQFCDDTRYNDSFHINFKNNMDLILFDSINEKYIDDHINNIKNRMLNKINKTNVKKSSKLNEKGLLIKLRELFDVSDMKISFFTVILIDLKMNYKAFFPQRVDKGKDWLLLNLTKVRNALNQEIKKLRKQVN